VAKTITSETPRLSFWASPVPEALKAKEAYEKLYPAVPPEEADVLITLGGDGFMLETMHTYLEVGIPIYGIHFGSVGFLMNDCPPEELGKRLQRAQPNLLYPLEMIAQKRDGGLQKALAFNEVSLLRQTHQAAKIQVDIDDVTRLQELTCDGVLIATPAGSTAYNLSVYGPILPLGSSLLALTPISAFRPRRWRGALLPEGAEVTFTVLESDKRSVSAVADFTEVRDVTSVTIRQIKSESMTLLFDHDHNLEERILREQFLV